MVHRGPGLVRPRGRSLASWGGPGKPQKCQRFNRTGCHQRKGIKQCQFNTLLSSPDTNLEEYLSLLLDINHRLNFVLKAHLNASPLHSLHTRNSHPRFISL